MPEREAVTGTMILFWGVLGYSGLGWALTRGWPWWLVVPGAALCAVALAVPIIIASL